MLIRLSDSARLYHADCRDAIKSLPDNSIDSVVTDPPYALVSIQKRFANSPRSETTENTETPYGRTGRGFMGQKWDTGETAFSQEFWAEVLRVLKPGGHVAAFGASRAYHRMACAIEDAGFEIRDSIINVIDPESPVINFMQSLNDEQLGAFLRCLDDAEFGGTLAWMYGTGFPKSQNVSKFIDKELGVEGTFDGFKTEAHANRKSLGVPEGWDRPWMHDADAMAKANMSYTPASPQAQEFDGFGTALKPAFEPIVLARKPLSEGTVAANVLRWGTGALNIDGCRVPHVTVDGGNLALNPHLRSSINGGNGGQIFPTEAERRVVIPDVKGRWPANVVLSYPEDTYELRADVTAEQRAELEVWLAANS